MHASGDLPCLQIAPRGGQQLASLRHDADVVQPSATMAASPLVLWRQFLSDRCCYQSRANSVAIARVGGWRGWEDGAPYCSSGLVIPARSDLDDHPLPRKKKKCQGQAPALCKSHPRRSDVTSVPSAATAKQLCCCLSPHYTICVKTLAEFPPSRLVREQPAGQLERGLPFCHLWAIMMVKQDAFGSPSIQGQT